MPIDPTDERRTRLQFSVNSILVAGAITVCALEVMRATVMMTLPYFVAWFAACSTPGMVYGYAKRGWPGGVLGGLISGSIGVALLFTTFVLQLELAP